MYKYKTHTDFPYALKFQEIYYGKKEKYDKKTSGDTRYTTIKFNTNSRLTQGTSYFESILYDKFFSKQIENDVCRYRILNIDPDEYKYYYCNKNMLSMTEMENINFLTDIQSDNMTFVLEPKDLFYEHKGVLYSLVIYKTENSMTFPDTEWVDGTPFLKKYLITFDRNDKLIYFYKEANNENEGNEGNEGNKGNENNKKNLEVKYKILIFFLIVAFLASIGGLIFYIIKIKSRKKKANELYNDYVYLDKNSENSDSVLIRDDDD